ncbi:phenylalanine--tRNA ligase subunit alpha [Thermophilibacter sp. ZX-H3]|uniref:phenylalanine--tRNA ligase subunit alpha n=1 Tax=Atopobiaceae TaxID=1643824 RepID=UPI00143B03C9|nr:phenylalanine--tRNA ligase subunit alpha [Olsenella sp. SW781]NJE80936.1 phenylalanine--tRNA ligase subunit alpha [Olsenella sp. SW781]
MSMSDDLKAIEAQFQEGLAAAETMEALEALRVSYLGKKGQLTAIMRSMGKVPPEERPAMGQLANTVRATVDAALKARKEELSAALLEQKMAADAVDVTLPGRRLSQGTQHLISQIREEIEDIFVGLGYTVEDGPYVESTWYNFTALNAPEDHPSRSAKDTFYVVDNAPGTMLHAEETNVQGESDILLRTQTSGVQVHVMENKKPPIYMICPGTVFRPDTADANHLPQFTQVEGLVVDEGITFGDLKGTLDYFTREIFGKDRATRYRPHFFPFTEPSCEVDVSCGVCGGKGCRFCKNTGWLEILGAGMVDPNVFEFCGIDPEKYTGFAFGIGVERVAALRYDLPDLRMLMTGDMRFLRQF